MIRRPWLLVALLCVTATASYLCRVNISVAGALLMRDFGLSQIQMGRVFSAFLLGYALFQVPAGMLADRWGARRILTLSAWGWVVVTLLQSLVGLGPPAIGTGGVLAAFLSLRFILGVAEAPTFPGAAQGVARWIPPASQGRANGIVIAAIGLGSAIAPPLLTAVMVRGGWRAALVVSAVPAFGVALTWLKARDPEDPANPEAGKEPVPNYASSPPLAHDRAVPPKSDASAEGNPLGSRSFFLLTLSYTLQGYVGYIFVFWFYLYLVQERHFDLLKGAVLSSLPWIFSIVSIPLGGWVSDRLVAGPLGLVWGRRVVPMIGLSGAGVFLALGAHTGNAYMAAAYLALSTAFVLSVEGPFWATMMELAPSRSGRAGGIMNMGSNLGGLVSPALTPVLAARIGWENALLLAAGLSVLGGLMWAGISVFPDRGKEA